MCILWQLQCVSSHHPTSSSSGWEGWVGLVVLPDVVVLLDVDLVKHHVLLLGVNVGFHLHGNVARKH